MKITKEKVINPTVALTIIMPKSVITDLTRLARDNKVSRQRLIAAIFDKALNDKKFEVHIKK